MTTTTEAASRRLFDELQSGDRVELLHAVKVGRQQWTTRVTGKVLRKERRRHGLHFRRNLDDKVFSDLLVLEADDGALTTVTMDEYTQLRRM